MQKNLAKGSVQLTMQPMNPEVPSIQRRKVLLLGAEQSVRGLISTFLITMGWTCIVVHNKEEMPAILRREVFDAVVIDLGRSEAEAEKSILGIERIRPNLAGRILALNSQDADRQMLELMERHDLVQLSRERLLPHLWASLEERVVSPRLRELAPRAMPAARLVFDSLREPLSAGVRTLSSGARQLAYQHERTIIDVSIDAGHGSGRMCLTGQVLAQGNKSKIGDLSVVLVNGSGTLARTTTNQFGEFHIECEFPEDLSLEIRLGERSWVLLPLGKMNWKDNKHSQVSRRT
jgi:hypothetical protein